MAVDFSHLHVHSEFSLLDGFGRLDALTRRARDLGMDALALTDHGVMYGAIDFYSAAKEAGIKPIIGVEAYVAPNSRFDKRPKIDTSPYHLVLLAADNTGYRNLIKLTTQAHTEGFYYKPRIDRELLAQHSEGLICLSACLAAEVPRLIRQGDLKAARDAAAWHRDVFGPDRYFLELQDHDIDDLVVVNRELIALGKELGLKVVATNDVHYVRQEDLPAQDLLLCIQTNTTLDDPNRMRMETNTFFLRSPEEMLRAFGEVPEALRTTRDIVEMCNLSLDFGRNYLPNFEIPAGFTPDSYLEHLCREGIRQRYGETSERVEERLRYELDVISQTGFALYILIVWDIVAYARRRGIIYGPRGSAAGALVCYLLGISDVDPIANNLTFERFLNIERKEMPDIDMDFADDRRDEMIEFVAQKYGRDRVAQIITFGTLGAKAAIRDAGRAMGIPFPDADRVAKLVPSLPVGITIEKAMADNPELQRLYEQDQAVRRLVDAAKSVEGVSRHASTHAAGVVISRDPLTECVPLQPTSRDDKNLMTQYHAYNLAKLGLLKMDFLGLANLTILGRAVEIIQQQRGEQIDLVKIPQDDEKTFKVFGNGETMGLFQVEGRGMTQYLRELKPTSIADLAAMVALYRPGPMGNIPHYIDRKHGRERVEYPHPLLEETLQDTYGVLTYQDQVLQVLWRVAGYSLGQADIVRRAMGKKIKALMDQEQPKFVAGCKANGLTDAEARLIWEILEPFAGYGFNRAHAACYAQLAYQTAYLKANYTVEYMVAVLHSAMGNADRVVLAVNECRRLSIPVLPPDVNRSDVGFTIESVVLDERTGAMRPGIRFGLAAVKNVGEAAVQPIIAARISGGPFTTIDDFCHRVEAKALNKRVLESLVKAGAFDAFGLRSQVLAVVDQIISVAQTAHRAAEVGQASLFELMPVSAPMATLTLPSLPDTPAKEKLGWEKELLGLYFSEHPTHRLQDELAHLVTCWCGEISEEFVGRQITIAGVVASVRSIVTKRRDTMATAILEDATGTVEVVAFPKTFEKTRDAWVEDQLLVVAGKLETREERFQVVVDAVQIYQTDDAGRLVRTGGSDDQTFAAARVASPSNGHGRNGNGHGRGGSDDAAPFGPAAAAPGGYSNGHANGRGGHGQGAEPSESDRPDDLPPDLDDDGGFPLGDSTDEGWNGNGDVAAEPVEREPALVAAVGSLAAVSVSAPAIAEATRPASESLPRREREHNGVSLPPVTAAAGLAPRSVASGPRQVAVTVRATGDGAADQQRLQQVYDVLRANIGGDDEVRLVIETGGRRIELEWPSVKLRWVGPLEKQLERYADAVDIADAPTEK